MTDQELMQLALDARKQAYAPYSRFLVGAALLSKDGTVYTGCNVENAAFSPTCCAERVAIFKAVSEGVREFSAIAIVRGKENELSKVCAPCGVCRQVLSEFCRGDLRILTGTPNDIQATTLEELLPLAFSPDNFN